MCGPWGSCSCWLLTVCRRTRALLWQRSRYRAEASPTPALAAKPLHYKYDDKPYIKKTQQTKYYEVMDSRKMPGSEIRMILGLVTSFANILINEHQRNAMLEGPILRRVGTVLAVGGPTPHRVGTAVAAIMRHNTIFHKEIKTPSRRQDPMKANRLQDWSSKGFATFSIPSQIWAHSPALVPCVAQSALFGASYARVLLLSLSRPASSLWRLHRMSLLGQRSLCIHYYNMTAGPFVLEGTGSSVPSCLLQSANNQRRNWLSNFYSTS